MSEITDEGLQLDTLQEILTAVNESQLAGVGDAELNQQADELLGVLNGIFAAKMSEITDLAQAVYNSMYPGTASAVALDNVASITGVTRLPATKTFTTATITGTPATVVPAGFQVKTNAAEDIFETTEESTISGGGTVDAIFQAIETGPIIANADTLETIVTPQAGVDSVNNADNVPDGQLGRDLETDAQLRARRIVLLSQGGNATLEAIRNAILAVDEVTEATVFSNDTDATVDSVPAHSIFPLVRGGDDTEIAQAIFDSKAAGILSYDGAAGPGGTPVSEEITDSQGIDHTIGFARPDAVQYEVICTVVFDPDQIEEGDAELAVQEAVVNYVLALGTGKDIIRQRAIAAIIAIPGVVDVSAYTHRINGAGSFVTTNLVLTAFEIGDATIGDVAVTLVEGAFT